MSSSLDSFEKPTSMFEGKVKDIEYHQSARGDQYALVSVRGVEKPLALPTSQQLPTMGDHVSVECNEGEAWFFPTHRATVIIKSADFELWRKPSSIPLDRRLQAEALILEYAEKHEEVSADDVALEIQNLFPERDPRIVGVIFLGLSKKGIIHKFGYKPSERRFHHGSPIPIWHMTLRRGK